MNFPKCHTSELKDTRAAWSPVSAIPLLLSIFLWMFLHNSKGCLYCWWLSDGSGGGTGKSHEVLRQEGLMAGYLPHTPAYAEINPSLSNHLICHFSPPDLEICKKNCCLFVCLFLEGEFKSPLFLWPIHLANMVWSLWCVGSQKELWKSVYRSFLLLRRICVCVPMAQMLSCIWLCNPMGYSPPGSSVHGIFLLQGIFPTQGLNLGLLSPSLTHGFFTSNYNGAIDDSKQQMTY